MEYQIPTTRAGLTVVELVIVIGLLLIVSSLIFTGFREYTAYQQYNRAFEQVKQLLHESQTEARLSVGGVEHGVKIDNNQITQFVGDTYVVSDPDNQVTVFNAILLTPNLTGAVDEIVFNSLTGHPSATGSISVDGASYNYTDSITVSAGGVVQ